MRQGSRWRSTVTRIDTAATAVRLNGMAGRKKETLRRRLRAWLGATLVAVWFTSLAQAADQRKACAAYDLHFVTLLEDHGRASEVPAEEIHRAATAVLDARAACRDGRFDHALHLYERVPLGAPGVAPTHWVVLR